MISNYLNFNFLNYFVNPFLKPSILLGMSNFVRIDSNSIFNSMLNFVKRLNLNTSFWKPISFISNYLGRISSYEIGFLPGVNSSFSSGSSKFTSFSYFCGVDSFNDLSYNSFIVYQGFFKANNFLFNKSNLILPSSTYLERTSVYLNLEGRLRFGRKAINAFKFIITDFEIIRVLLLLRKNSKLDNFSKLSNFYSLMSFFKGIIDYFCQYIYNLKALRSRIFYITGLLLENHYNFDTLKLAPDYSNLNFIVHDFLIINSMFNKTVNNYYSDDCFSKNSKVMSICTIKTFIRNFSKNILN